MQSTLTGDMPIIQPAGDRCVPRPIRVQSLPRDMFDGSHESQCKWDHGKTLEQLRIDGGCNAGDAIAIIACLPRDMLDPDHAHRLLYAMRWVFIRGKATATVFRMPGATGPLP